MSHAVLIVSNETISKMKTYYHSYLLPKVPQGSVFAAKTEGCSITAYRSGKVLFQGKNASQEVNKWEKDGKGSTATSSVKKGKTTNLPPNFSSLSVIGSDEVGTGDYFGPITVVAAYVAKEQIPLLKELGVRDSKDLNDVKIVEIAKQLVTFLPYSLLILHNEKYNEWQQKGMSQGKMKALLHNKAIHNVLTKIEPSKPDAILIDQFVEQATYYKHIAKDKQIVKENVYFSTKGESVHLAVAAASIMARYAFLREMDKLSKVAGITIPKGAGAQVDIAAAKLIQKQGIDSLSSLTKLHFANTQKALKLAKK
ncbi:ribonuclease HIII [Bacillus sp. CGMCC 1.16541]|uniref:ribonuclease HIII n=1 Tax=Bacillus sp. CGMCC 1.16541 TaxID=2185143 RepID=UPI000D725D0A|nr:ribonuclease HIII [Bacillus sp. CGMCC 1.16541]